MGNMELMAFSSNYSSSVSTGCLDWRHVGTERPAGTEIWISGLTECFKMKLNCSGCRVCPKNARWPATSATVLYAHCRAMNSWTMDILCPLLMVLKLGSVASLFNI